MKSKKRAKRNTPRDGMAIAIEKIGDRIQAYPPDAATLQGWIDGSIKPPVQGAQSMLLALACEVLTWRESYLRSKRLSIETKSGTFRLEIPKEAMDILRALLDGGQ